MTNPVNPFDAMMQAGKDWAKALNPALDSFAPKGFEDMWSPMSAEAMEAMMGKTFNPEGLDAKTRLLLTLHGLTISGAQAESQIRLTVRHARSAGATKQEIAETIAQAALFGGVPAMTKAMEFANEAMAEGTDKDRDE